MAPKNVLLMIADDLGFQLGCYGAPVKTPNIDQLAAEGTLFEKAFASTASCSCSRSSVYTGMHTHQNGQYGLASGRHHFTTYDHIETAPALLNKHPANYLTAIIGKIHVGPEHVYPWSLREENTTRDVSWVADRAGALFSRSKDESRPFFLTIGFIDPHRDMTRSGFGNEGPFDARVKTVHYDPADVQVPEFLSDLPGVRTEFANYYESISRMDQGVGLILANLKAAGLDRDTLVIFISDNGPPFINSKTTLYDAGVHLPLIVRRPGSSSPSASGGVKNPNLVSWVDILPTILDYTASPDLHTNPRRLGRSFLPMIDEGNELPDWGTVYGSHTFHEVTNYWPTRFLRTRRYKYHRNIAWRLDFPFAADIYGSLSWEDIRNAETSPRMIGSRPLRDFFFRPPEELYDLERDPHEVRNLVEDKAYADVLEGLRDELEAWQRRTDDPWLYRDGVSVWFVKHHLAAGMEMPDKWDLDADHPESKGEGIKTYAPLPFGPEASYDNRKGGF